MSDLKCTSADFLDSDHVEREELVEHADGIDHHFGEELLLMRDQFWAQRCGSTLNQ